LANAHGELSANKKPTCYKVFPLLEMLRTQWEEFRGNPKYVPVHHALAAGLDNMRKWYYKTDDTSIYFISHGMDSVYVLLVNVKLVSSPQSEMEVDVCRGCVGS
jgi:hypothetical protein